MSQIDIRTAKPDDSTLILKFVRELAAFEKAAHEVRATESEIAEALFGENPSAHALICRIDDQPVGFALYFFNYSTWLGKRGLYLEDLYISPAYRKMGTGKALLKFLARIAVSNNCGRFEWSVLDWNKPAIDFYESIGATPQDEWICYRLSGKALENFANP